MSNPSYIPPGYHSITPRIFAEEPGELVAFMRTVFEATGETSVGAPTEVRIGDSIVIVSGTEARGPFPAFLYVYVEDTDAAYRRAMEAGANSLEEPRDVPYGDRRAMFADRWGNVWQVATRKKQR